MNNKEFIAELARRTNSNAKETQQKMNVLVQEITERLCEEDSISISNFGVFETKKRLERVLVSPTPKMVVGFKQSGVLKNKIQ